MLVCGTKSDRPLDYLVTMKITVPEGKKAQIVDAVCKFVGFKDEGLIESGSVLVACFLVTLLGVLVR